MMASTDMDKDLRTDRPLTEKGQSMYESSVDKYLNRLNEQWKNIELIISTIDNSARYSVLCKFEDKLEQGHAKLTLIKDDFVKYLNRTKTTESQECLAKLTTTFDEKTNTLEEEFQRISHLKGEKLETASVFSHRPWSAGSRMDTAVAAQRAKAQAAKIRLKYAEEENLVLKKMTQLEEQQKKEKANMERSKAEFEADLQLLSVKKEAATAEAELHVFQEEDQGSLFDALSDTEDITTLQAEVSSWRLGEYWTLIQNGRTILTIRTFISYLKHYLFMRMLYLKLDYLNPITLHYKNLPPQEHLIPSYQSSSHSPTTSLEQCTLSFPNSQSFY